ncbi:hypothetical protein [Vibrio nitrifigilis]|uniref:Lipoprotein n=1 Tax=Vibrio nitrifigilis TaxID=2789781 RepID=A0ABS0GD12_9VIBR|nr:hypothetical protein [Vibrio nitrifigilis]MBF9000300.1 hypothetical protein [Vibrio nitrifigilis]
MKRILLFCIPVALSGCSAWQQSENNATSDTTVTPLAQCLGHTQLPEKLANQFYAVNDSKLLNQSLGEPGKGKLCNGAVYQAKPKTKVVIYRAWNSTNPNSKLGSWWAFSQPSGSIAKYRENYEICYQWSPLDKLVRCTLKPGTKIVLGGGQSAECSQYLSYPTSKSQQIFIEDASSAVKDCVEYTGMMSWIEAER